MKLQDSQALLAEQRTKSRAESLPNQAPAKLIGSQLIRIPSVKDSLKDLKFFEKIMDADFKP